MATGEVSSAGGRGWQVPEEVTRAETPKVVREALEQGMGSSDADLHAHAVRIIDVHSPFDDGDLRKAVSNLLTVAGDSWQSVEHIDLKACSSEIVPFFQDLMTIPPERARDFLKILGMEKETKTVIGFIPHLQGLVKWVRDNPTDKNIDNTLGELAMLGFYQNRTPFLDAMPKVGQTGFIDWKTYGTDLIYYYRLFEISTNKADFVPLAEFVQALPNTMVDEAVSLLLRVPDLSSQQLPKRLEILNKASDPHALLSFVLLTPNALLGVLEEKIASIDPENIKPHEIFDEKQMELLHNVPMHENIFWMNVHYPGLGDKIVKAAESYLGAMQWVPTSGSYFTTRDSKTEADDFVLYFGNKGDVPKDLHDEVAKRFITSPAQLDPSEQLRMCCWEFCYVALMEAGVVTESQVQNILLTGNQSRASFKLVDALCNNLDITAFPTADQRPPNRGDILLFEEQGEFSHAAIALGEGKMVELSSFGEIVERQALRKEPDKIAVVSAPYLVAHFAKRVNTLVQNIAPAIWTREQDMNLRFTQYRQFVKKR